MAPINSIHPLNIQHKLSLNIIKIDVIDQTRSGSGFKWCNILYDNCSGFYWCIHCNHTVLCETARNRFYCLLWGHFLHQQIVVWVRHTNKCQTLVIVFWCECRGLVFFCWIVWWCLSNSFQLQFAFVWSFVLVLFSLCSSSEFTSLLSTFDCSEAFCSF